MRTWEAYAAKFVEKSVQHTIEDLPRVVAMGCRAMKPHYFGYPCGSLPSKEDYEHLVPEVIVKLKELGETMGFDVVRVDAGERYGYRGGYCDPRDFWELVW